MKDLKTYLVHGKITIDVELEVEATSEDDAHARAEEYFADEFSLDAHGGSHDPETYEMNLYVDELDEEDDE